MSKSQIQGCAELLIGMGCAELLTFDEAMAALRRFGDTTNNSLWPTLNGNDVYALANAAADAYRQKLELEKPRSQKLREAGFSRRPSHRSLPSDE